MDLNLNMLFDKLANFKIKFTEKPSPTEISNKDLVFIIETPTHIENIIQYQLLKFKDIELNKDADRIEIRLEQF